MNAGALADASPGRPAMSLYRGRESTAEVVQLVLSSAVTPEFEKQSKAYGLETCASD